MGKEIALPKNIRQIGDIQGREKICMEDYVMTYIRKKEQQGGKGFLGVFLGDRQETEDTVYLFVRGIMDCSGRLQKKTAEDLPLVHLDRTEIPRPTEDNGTDGAKKEESDSVLDSAFQENLQREYQEYFGEGEIVGCCVIGKYPTAEMETLTAGIPEAAGFLYHLQEQEETLYWLENGQYIRKKGYLIFYEQNRKMQAYLAKTFRQDCVEKESQPDKAIQSFRTKVKEKTLQKRHSMLKLASSFFVVTVLVIGAIMVTRVENMHYGTLPEPPAVENQIAQEPQPVVEYVLDENPTPTQELPGSDSFWAEGELEDRLEDKLDNELVEKSEDELDLPELEAAEEISATDSEPDQQTGSRRVQAAYVIREGDTLANICSQYYGSLDRMEELCAVNGIQDANMILPGQTLTLP